jgi:hypothetical protein
MVLRLRISRIPASIGPGSLSIDPSMNPSGATAYWERATTGVDEPDARIRQAKRLRSFSGMVWQRSTRSKLSAAKQRTASGMENTDTTSNPAD